MAQMTDKQIEELVKAIGKETFDRMVRFTSGHREIVWVNRYRKIELFYETWYDFDNGRMQNHAVKGFVVSEPYNEYRQHRFQVLSQADDFFASLVEKYAREIGLYALGITND